MTDEEAQRKLETDEDFVCLKRFDYSLRKVVERYPDGCPDRVIASALMLSEEELAEVYETIVSKLRGLMGVTL